MRKAEFLTTNEHTQSSRLLRIPSAKKNMIHFFQGSYKFLKIFLNVLQFLVPSVPFSEGFKCVRCKKF